MRLLSKLFGKSKLKEETKEKEEPGIIYCPPFDVGEPIIYKDPITNEIYLFIVDSYSFNREDAKCYYTGEAYCLEKTGDPDLPIIPTSHRYLSDICEYEFKRPRDFLESRRVKND